MMLMLMLAIAIAMYQSWWMIEEMPQWQRTRTCG